jgi:hypothetical protein
MKWILTLLLVLSALPAIAQECEQGKVRVTVTRIEFE